LISENSKNSEFTVAPRPSARAGSLKMADTDDRMPGAFLDSEL